MGPTLRELYPKSGNGAVFPPLGMKISMTDISPRPQWYALTVRHQHERQTERVLQSQGWETLVPVYRSQRQWSDRVKQIELPLFAGYVFCRFALRDRVRVEDTPGVAQIVKFNGLAAPLEDREIAEIQAICASGARLSPWPYLKAGDRVRVERGPLRGLEGTLLRDGGDARLVVSVELLQRSIAAEIDPSMVVPLRAFAKGA
ncbi:MAG: UpxY family transcription antiterminator [Bryobacteraceae bacterium]